MLAFVAVVGLAVSEGKLSNLPAVERKQGLSFQPFEAGSSPAFGLGGILEQFPPALYPELNAAERSRGSSGWLGTPGFTSSEDVGIANPAPAIRAEWTPLGPQDPLYLNLYLPTHIDHDGAVVSAASVRVRALGGVLSESEVVAFLREAGAPEAWIPDLVTISWCESHHSPFALGDSGNSLGQYQLWLGWFRAGEDPFDPLTNARVAVRVRETRGRFGGAGGWSCAGLNGIY